MIRITDDVYRRMVGHCYDELPLEGCGLIGGEPATGKATICYPTTNVAQSSKLYTVDPKQHLRADRDAESRGLYLVRSLTDDCVVRSTEGGTLVRIRKSLSAESP